MRYLHHVNYLKFDLPWRKSRPWTINYNVSWVTDTQACLFHCSNRFRIALLPTRRICPMQTGAARGQSVQTDAPQLFAFIIQLIAADRLELIQVIRYTARVQWTMQQNQRQVS
jgi:hypothetical protein